MKNDFIIEKGVLLEYKGSDVEINIPEGIFTIGTQAFESNKSVIKVVFPKSLRVINPLAFMGCSGLKEVVFNEGLKSIGNAAFSFCTSLEYVELPETVETLGCSVFSGCESLLQVKLPSKVIMSTNSIGNSIRPANGIFNRCPKLINAGPKGDECFIEFTWADKIPPMMFYGSNLKEVNIPRSISVVSEFAFRRCERNMRVTISPYCVVKKKAFDEDVHICFTDPVNTKDKIGSGLDEYITATQINGFSDKELAWIYLYQSKKWRNAISDSISGEKAGVIIKYSYMILENVKKVSKIQGKAMLDLLNKRKGCTTYPEEVVEMKQFLENKKCELEI